MEDIEVICSVCRTPAVLVEKDREHAFVKSYPASLYVCRKCQQHGVKRHQAAAYAMSTAGKK